MSEDLDFEIKETIRLRSFKIQEIEDAIFSLKEKLQKTKEIAEEALNLASSP